MQEETEDDEKRVSTMEGGNETRAKTVVNAAAGRRKPAATINLYQPGKGESGLTIHKARDLNANKAVREFLATPSMDFQSFDYHTIFHCRACKKYMHGTSLHRHLKSCKMLPLYHKISIDPYNMICQEINGKKASIPRGVSEEERKVILSGAKALRPEGADFDQLMDTVTDSSGAPSEDDESYDDGGHLSTEEERDGSREVEASDNEESDDGEVAGQKPKAADENGRKQSESFAFILKGRKNAAGKSSAVAPQKDVVGGEDEATEQTCTVEVPLPPVGIKKEAWFQGPPYPSPKYVDKNNWDWTTGRLREAETKKEGPPYPKPKYVPKECWDYELNDLVRQENCDGKAKAKENVARDVADSDEGGKARAEKRNGDGVDDGTC